MDSEPSQKDINSFRIAILDKISAAGEDVVHPKDLQRVKDEDYWLRRFLMHHELNQKEALQMVWSTLQWRKDYGTNDINEQTVKMELLILGGFFPRGKDIDGALLFIFKCKRYVKNQHNTDELKRCVIYWMERLERESNGKPITLFFDMEGCGLANMDLDLTKYLIGLFKDYYPYFLNYVLVFEMPWVLSAAFKVVKSWLPEKAVRKIKFVSKKDIKDWVPLNQALTCWGGEDDYTFSFVPEALSKDDIPNHNNNNRKVRFDDGKQMSDVGSTITASGDGLLSVSPDGLIKFLREQDNEYISNLVLQNTSSSPISFKVKTTAPEKFRVRPGYGCLSPGTKTSVTVCLLQAYRSSNIAKDKFLILSTPIEDADLSTEEVTNLWKTTSVKKENQIHLRCAPLNEVVRNGTILHTTHETEPNLGKLTATLREIKENDKEFHGTVKSILYIQISLLVLLLAAVLYLITSQNRSLPVVPSDRSP